MLSTVMQVAGAALIIAAAFTVGVTVGLTVAGVVVVALGVLLERKGR